LKEKKLIYPPTPEGRIFAKRDTFVHLADCKKAIYSFIFLLEAEGKK